MPPVLHPDGRPMLIGSQPLTDHEQATELVLRHVPEIPNWVQLPVYPQEGMVAQFAPGMPGLVRTEDRIYVDTARDDFDARMVAFFEAYLGVMEQPEQLDESPFALDPALAQGFFSFLAALAARRPSELFAVKGQITGPFTFCTGLTDQDRRAIFYDDALRDAAVKMMAVKAAWQVRQLARFQVPVILFIDEPALAGYGSSEFISISRQDIVQCLSEVIQAVHDQGGAAGVHVCANTDWSLLLEAGVDIVNFDACGYFDKVMLYGRQLAEFIGGGGCLAWGMVPTGDADQVAEATLDGLWADWQAKVAQLAAIGLDPRTIRRQAFITPSCGTGSLPPDAGAKVLALTRDLARRVRAD